MGKALTLALMILLVSCQKDTPQAPANSVPGSSGNVYVVCEGNFNASDASLYAWEPESDSVFGDIYAQVNHKTLGDVFQSMQHIGDKLFLCINNSDKVVVLNAADWSVAATLSIRKPRYILPVSKTKAYVSSEYNNKVYIINPLALQVTGSIDLPFVNTEGMCLYNNLAFVCCWDTACHAVFAIDVNSDQVTQTYSIPGAAPQEVLIDKEQMLWILAGDQPYGTPATLIHMDPSSGSILSAYHFPAQADPVKPVFNAAKDTLYYMEAYNAAGQSNGVYRMDIHATGLPAGAFIAQRASQYFWALGVNPSDGNIYVADAKDFNQKGTVYIYQPAGAPVVHFDVGPGPGHFYFDE